MQEERELVFAALPAETFKRKGKWVKRIDQLREHPQRWVDATETWGLVANQTYYVTLPPRGIEVAIRRVDDGTLHLFVRWVGDSDGDADG